MTDDATPPTEIDPGPADPPPLGAARTSALLAVVTGAGLMGTAAAVAAGRADSALLFVGVPVLLALLVGLLRLRGAGAVFQVVTVVLLLSAALLHEAAVCVLLASPLVYGVAFLAYGMVRLTQRGEPGIRHALGPALLVLVALEGVGPGLRLDPVQHAAAATTTAAPCAEVAASLDTGPRFEAASRGALLDVAGYPTPTAATGDGLAVGDTWALASAGGEITTRVVAARPGRVDFEVVSDTSRTTRWVGLRGGRLTWEPAGGGCRVEVGVDYERRLDPGLWFGPVSAVFMDAGARVLLRALV